MTRDEAHKLAYRLRCDLGNKTLYAYVRENETRIAFSGGAQGEHSIDFEVSSLARVKAHWAGYCENNGHVRAKVGQSVVFPSSSAPSGKRIGRVVSAGPDRLKVAFTYNHGGKSTKDVPVHQCRVVG